MLNDIYAILFGRANILINILFSFMLVRLAIMIVFIRRGAIRKQLLKYIQTEFTNICLVCASALVDRMLIILDIEWNWSIAVSFTLLVILDELSFVITKSDETFGTTLLRKVVSLLRTQINSKES